MLATIAYLSDDEVDREEDADNSGVIGAAPESSELPGSNSPSHSWFPPGVPWPNLRTIEVNTIRIVCYHNFANSALMAFVGHFFD